MRSTLAAIAASLLVAAACGSRAPAPPAPHNTPTGTDTGPGTSGPLLGATSILIEDVWVGLGCTHDFTATVTPEGGDFAGDAELAIGYGHEHGAHKRIVVPRKTIAALQQAAEAARVRVAAAPPEDVQGSTWTDDYPTGSITFTTPGGVQKIGFTDQHRMLQWEHDGKVEPLDTPHDIFEDSKPSEIWDAYNAVLEAADLRAWIDDSCGRR